MHNDASLIRQMGQYVFQFDTVQRGTLEAALNKEHNDGKSSCFQTTTGHHALTELNPLYIRPLRGEQGGLIVRRGRGGSDAAFTWLWVKWEE